MVEEKHKALRAPGTQKKKKKAGKFWKAIKNYIKKSTLSELQFFPACPEGSQNRGQSGMFEIKKKKVCYHSGWKNHLKKSPGKLDNQRAEGEVRKEEIKFVLKLSWSLPDP